MFGVDHRNERLAAAAGARLLMHNSDRLKHPKKEPPNNALVSPT